MAIVDYAPPQKAVFEVVRYVEKKYKPPFPDVVTIGTGGCFTDSSYLDCEIGYKPLWWVIPDSNCDDELVIEENSCKLMMEQIHGAFDRTMNRVPSVFGVSRQTIYGWLSGDKHPKEIHRAKLQELADAARVFKSNGYKPTGVDLERTVFDGKSLLTLIAEGKPGKEIAEELILLIKEGNEKAGRLKEILEGREDKSLDSFKVGSPHLDDF